MRVPRQGTNIDPFPDLEPTKICDGDDSCYDDTVLERLDDFMVDAHSYGIKVRARVLAPRVLRGRTPARLTAGTLTAHHHDA